MILSGILPGLNPGNFAVFAIWVKRRVFLSSMAEKGTEIRISFFSPRFSVTVMFKSFIAVPVFCGAKGETRTLTGCPTGS